ADVDLVRFSPDGDYLISGDKEGLKIWRLQTQPDRSSSTGVVLTLEKPIPGSFAESLLFSADSRYVSFIRDVQGNNELCLWDFKAPAPPRVVATNVSISRQVQAFTPDSRYLLKTDTDRPVVTFDVGTGKEERRFQTETNLSPAELLEAQRPRD